MQTGLDRLFANDEALGKLVRGAKVALLAHPASVTSDLVHAGEVLVSVGAKTQVVFGPEHGFGGEAQDMIGVLDARDRNGTKVRSLYGDTFEALSPRPEDLDDIDAMVLDLQDVGARYYTFVWTAVLAMRACRKAGKRVVVLDRPNPIGAALATVEGRRQSPGFTSFVGLEAIPIRHGLTLGEIVAWCANKDGATPEDVQIVGTRGLERSSDFYEWDRPWVPPSPNMPSIDTALVYPGGCLLEGTNLSEGRGTTRPFEQFGAPWIDGARLAHEAKHEGLAGCIVRPCTFRPTFHKHAGETCGGVFVHVTDARFFRPVATYLTLITLAQRQDPDKFKFRSERYEFVEDIPAFDLLTGDGEARALIATGAPAKDVARVVARVLPADLDVVRAAREAAAERTI